MDRPHLRSISVNDFVRWNDERTLLLSPKFQRRRVWPPKARAFLIDTILRGLPIPKLYMRQLLDMRSSKTAHEIRKETLSPSRQRPRTVGRANGILEHRHVMLRLSAENTNNALLVWARSQDTRGH